MSTDTDLARQQRALAAQIRAEPGFGDADAAVRALLLQRGGVAPRLSVYRMAYRARLVEALRSNYPVLHRVLGDTGFESLALRYLGDHASRDPSIRWFGHRLPQWLARHSQELPHPSLSDLARMEWAIGSAFDAADAPTLARERLAAVPGEDWPFLMFELHPSVQLVTLAWDVEPIWRKLTDDPETNTRPPKSHGHALLVWRKGLDTRWRILKPGEAAALNACAAGARFEELCALAGKATADEAGAAATVVGWVGEWIQAGVLRDFGT